MVAREGGRCGPGKGWWGLARVKIGASGGDETGESAGDDYKDKVSSCGVPSEVRRLEYITGPIPVL